MHVPLLIATIAVAMSAALLLGYLATRIRLSPIVGYLVAGIAIGPYTPGLVADVSIAGDLAEMGVALLMFGVGLHFSPRDLAAVRALAIPGALAQSLVATLLGVALGMASGWGLGGGLVLGLAVSVASTVVLVRGLEDRDLIQTPGGRTAVGWLIVEDLLTVVILVVLPAVSGALGGTPSTAGSPWVALGITLLKVVLMVALVLVIGRFAVPWLLDRVARAQSRELFTLAVLAIALGIACAAAWGAGVSLALGAFLAGMVVGQSELSHRAAADSIPLRDAFAVLFFVSVGMLFDPRLVLDAPGLLFATLAIILVAKPLVALLLVLVSGHPLRMALTVAVGLAQIGEFSFIMASVGSELGLLPAVGHDAVLAGAIVSITLNPWLFRAIDPLDRFVARSPSLSKLLARLARRRGASEESAPEGLKGHVVLCGSGRVGTVVGRVLTGRGWPAIVVESDRVRATRLRERGLRVVDGDAGSGIVLDHAGVRDAALMVISFSDPLTARLAIDHARRVNPELPIVARVDSRSERDHLENVLGVQAVMGEFEVAAEIARRALLARGLSTVESEAVVMELRRSDRGGADTEPTTNLVEIDVPAGSIASGMSLAELEIPESTRVVTVRRRGDEMIARGQTVLEEGDRLLVLADPPGLEAFRTVLERRRG